MIEIFKDIEGYENLYQISNKGNLKSLGNDKTRKEKKIKLLKRKNGYLKVGLYKQGKRKFYLVHRLVAQAFIPNPDNLEQVNHKDEVKTNNNVTNLEWCTRLYNNNYGTHNQRSAESNTNHPNTSKKVLCIETGKIYPSTGEVERQLGLSRGNISSVCTGRYKTCGGFHWKYVS